MTRPAAFAIWLLGATPAMLATTYPDADRDQVWFLISIPIWMGYWVYTFFAWRTILFGERTKNRPSNGSQTPLGSDAAADPRRPGVASSSHHERRAGAPL